MIKIILTENEDGKEVFSFFDGEKLLAKCYFSSVESEIYDFFVLDNGLSDFLIINLTKAVLNHFALQGRGMAYCKNLCFETVLTKQGFKKDGNILTACIDEFFNHTCCKQES